MYHPTRGGVRGGRDQFSWDDVKVDKHRENYLGHSIKAPVGRWQKGKDLHWYARDKRSDRDIEAAKEEIRRIKEEEEQAMREALGLAPKRATRSQGNRLDKHEFAELVKRGSTAEDLGAGHADAARVDGLGFSKAPRAWEEPSSASIMKTESVEKTNVPVPEESEKSNEEESEDESSRKKRRREEKRQEKHAKREEKRHEKLEERRQEKREKRHSRDSEDKRRHKRDRERRRDSD